jgi:DNA-binding transcriptional LysR family regulator
MNLEANDLLLFARVADEGSFSRAAELTGLPKSTISRRVAALEARLGERLLLRTTRKLTVTDFGHSILEHAHQVAAEVDAVSSFAQHRQSEPSGRLRVSMPADLANHMLSNMLAEFVARYPAISLELDLSPRRVDLIGENFDLAIRMGDLPNDATLAARCIAVFSSGLYAAPSYIERRGMPQSPDELLRHDALRLLTRAGTPLPWSMQRDGVKWEGVPAGRATVNSPDLLLRMARFGSGITMMDDHSAEPFVRCGELVPVLPGWALPSSSAWAVFPGRRLMPARTRVFLDALEALFDASRCKAAQQRIERTLKASAAAADMER